MSDAAKGLFFFVTGDEKTCSDATGRIIEVADTFFLVEILDDQGERIEIRLEPVTTPDWRHDGSTFMFSGRKETDWRFYASKEEWMRGVTQRRIAREEYEKRERKREQERKLWWRSFWRSFCFWKRNNILTDLESV